jgi:hypothetical protein
MTTAGSEIVAPAQSRTESVGARGSNRRRVDGGVWPSSLDQLQEYLEEVEQERAAEAAMTKLGSVSHSV